MQTMFWLLLWDYQSRRIHELNHRLTVQLIRQGMILSHRHHWK
jgi:hypothetical protein